MSIDDNGKILAARVQLILDEAARQGATDAEVAASQDRGLSVNVRAGDVETIEFNQDQGFGITVYFGQRKGSASTSDNSDESIRDTVRAACNIARFTEEDEYAGLAEEEQLAQEVEDLELFYPSDVAADDAKEAALACEAAALAADERVNKSDGASMSTHQVLRCYGNSRGFIGHQVGSRYGLSCMAIAVDQAGKMQRDYWYTVARQHESLDEPAAVGVKAAQRAARRLGARKPQTGRYPVLFVPEVAGGLLSSLIGALSGGALYRKASFLLDSLGSEVLNPAFSVFEQPRLKGAMGSSAFDGDGVATRDNYFVRDGVVENYVLSCYSARRLDMQTTGNASGVHNLCVSGPTRAAEDLLKGMQRGFMVTELMGQGVNMVTGDYSRGAAGFWVDNGEIQHPVDEVTIASNLKDMYQNLVALGDDVDTRGNVRAPSMLVEGMTLAAPE